MAIYQSPRSYETLLMCFMRGLRLCLLVADKSDIEYGNQQLNQHETSLSVVSTNYPAISTIFDAPISIKGSKRILIAFLRAESKLAAVNGISIIV